MEAVLNEQEVLAVLESSVRPASIAKEMAPTAPRTAGVTMVRQYIDMQELCRDFNIPKHHGESVALLVLVDLLADATPALTVTEAGLILNIPGATTARKLRELSETGLLEVHQDPTDKRRFHPRMTATGKVFLRRYEKLMSSAGEGDRLPRRLEEYRRRQTHRVTDMAEEMEIPVPLRARA